MTPRGMQTVRTVRFPVALCRTPHWDRALPDGKAMLEDAATRLRAAGAEIVESELPPECGDVSEVQRRHSVFEALRVHAPELYRHEALLSADLRPAVAGSRAANALSRMIFYYVSGNRITCQLENIAVRDGA